MTVLDAVLLGIVQGITEFLPVSSDGHLALMHHALGFGKADLTFDVFLHAVTLMAILLFFRNDIRRITRQEIGIIIVGTIPAVMVGLLLKSHLESLSSSLLFVGGCLVITGLMNLQAARCLRKAGERSQHISYKQGFLIGLFQAFAILPGISRSGGTVAAAVTQDIDRETAFRFSFLLGIPAIAGASLLQFVDAWQLGFPGVVPLPYVAGGITAFVVGMAALYLFRWVMKQAKLQWFGWYAVLAGVVTMILSLS